MAIHRAGAVDYPTSDGRPMAETDIHRQQMTDLIGALRLHYAHRDDVYVSGNLLVFYAPGDKHKHVSPDVMVVFGAPPGDRLNFLVWEEHAAPTVVIEITSKSTRREDEITKKALYLSLGVREYYLFDPTGEYLSPRLRGWHAAQGTWVRVHDGAMHSPSLSLDLRVIDSRLRLVDPVSGNVVPTEAEAERQRAEAERQRADAERQRAEAERQRAEAAEAEVRRLRALRGGD